MSIEALWAVQYTAANGLSIPARSGGVVVLETGRLFGGDTWMFYTGSYKRLADGKYSILLQTGVHFTAGGQSIFGGPLRGQDYDGEVSVAADQKTMNARLTIVGSPQMVLTAVLTRVAALP